MSDTIDALIRLRAAGDAPTSAVIDPSARIDYATLDSDSLRLAATLVERGVGKGSRVGLIMPNGVEWVLIAVALTRIGAVLVPLSTLLSPRELVAQLRVASVQYLLTVDEFRGHRYRDALCAELAISGFGDEALQHPKLPALRQVWKPDALIAAVAGPDPTRVVDAMTAAVTPSDPLVVMFTSGSTGMPKGVVHSHGSALGAVRSSIEPRCIGPDTRLYLPMPFFWVGGFAGGVLSALLAGATLVTEPSSHPDTTLRLIERERVTLFRGWPDQAEALAHHADSAGVDLSSLRPGSLEALLPPERRGRPGARATLFGMTEAFGPYCGFRADADMPESVWGSCGRPFSGMEVRIIDVDDGVPAPPGTVGMIQIRGPHTLRGICRRSREDVFTADGFYPTGDLGHLDDDGFMFYHGRSDDMFKVSGATVYPSEVEQALRTIAGVDGAFVTNVPGDHGDRVGAVVVCDTGSTTVQELHTAARRLLSSFKVPTVWLLLGADGDVPRGSTGKADVARIREMLTASQTLEIRQ